MDIRIVTGFGLLMLSVLVTVVVSTLLSMSPSDSKPATPDWVKECAKVRPLDECIRDYQKIEWT